MVTAYDEFISTLRIPLFLMELVFLCPGTNPIHLEPMIRPTSSSLSWCSLFSYWESERMEFEHYSWLSYKIRYYLEYAWLGIPIDLRQAFWVLNTPLDSPQ